MAQNKAPTADSFCPQLPTVDAVPAIHFPGGALFTPTIDATRGTPSSCGLTTGLLQEIQAALAPFQPLLDVIDMVTTLAQCTLLLVEVTTNPFKIPDLLACVPGLIEKINAVLALVPVLPQGIVEFITFVVDTLRFIGQQIDCLVLILKSIQQQLLEVGQLINALSETDDVEIQAALQTQIACSQKNAQIQGNTAIGAFGPIARLLCTARTYLALTGDKGKEIAKKLAVPDPTQVQTLDEAISVLSTVKDIILGTVDLVVEIAAPFGGVIPPPPLVFTCPLDQELGPST